MTDWAGSIFSSAVIIAIIELIRWRMGVLSEQRKNLGDRHNFLEDRYYDELKEFNKTLKGELDAVKDVIKAQASELDRWRDSYRDVLIKFHTLEVQYDVLLRQYKDLTNSHETLQKEYLELKSDYASAVSQLNRAIKNSDNETGG
jgi:chromosome segregation ATPase